MPLLKRGWTKKDKLDMGDIYRILEDDKAQVQGDELQR